MAARRQRRGAQQASSSGRARARARPAAHPDLQRGRAVVLRGDEDLRRDVRAPLDDRVALGLVVRVGEGDDWLLELEVPHDRLRRS
eukprot:1873228-Prymnesium_polylepis.1